MFLAHLASSVLHHEYHTLHPPNYSYTPENHNYIVTSHQRYYTEHFHCCFHPCTAFDCTPVLHVAPAVAVAFVALGFVVEGEGEAPGVVSVGTHILLGTRGELVGT